MWTYQQTDELCHYGIPGMRWGRRKAKDAPSGAGGRKGKKATGAAKTSKPKMSKEERAAKGKATAKKILNGIGKTAVGAVAVAGVAGGLMALDLFSKLAKEFV